MASGVTGAVRRLYEDDWRQRRIVNDIKLVHARFRSFRPVEDSFVNNDGTTHRLVLLKGTLPITYRGAEYNIPLEVWLPRLYPNNAPTCYVRPVAGMEVPEKHPSVSTCGRCSLPYLEKWAATSKIMKLLDHMVRSFSESPPVYSKPAPQPTVDAPLYPASVDRSPSAHLPLPSQSQSHMSASAPRAELERRIEMRLNAMREQMQHARDHDMKTGEVLIERQLMFNDKQRELEESILAVDGCTEAVDAWLSQVELEQGEEVQVDYDAVVCFADAVSQQHAQALSRDLACEDAAYALRKALERGCVEFDTYIKLLRNLHRDQFYARALGVKIWHVKQPE